jgi:hypothetical protein
MEIVPSKMQAALNLLLHCLHKGQTLYDKMLEGKFLLEDGRQEEAV